MEAMNWVFLNISGRIIVKLVARPFLFAATALVPIALAIPTVAFAQEAETADDGGIKDILVTARRTQETLQDTPVAVSVVTADQIAERGLTSIDDFAKQSSGISFSQAFGRFSDRPVIRGASNVLANVQFGVETGAAYFVDGIYYQGDLQGFDPSAIERVEIVKGPQSALYGRNTYAGAINYITKDPTKDLTVSGRARYAEHDEIEGTLSVSGPLLGEVLGFRAGVRYYDYGGEFRNNITGKKVGQENTKSGYLTLLFKPTPEISMRTRATYQRDRDGTRAFFLQGAAANNCFPGYRSAGFRGAGAPPLGLSSTNRNQFYCGVVQPQPNNIFLNTDPATYTLRGAPVTAQDGTAFDGIFNSQISVSNVLSWDIGDTGLNLSVLSGFRKNKNSSGSDSDHSEAFSTFGAPGEPLFTISDRDRQIDMSQEFKLSTAEDQPIRATIGGYIFKQKFWSQDYTFENPVARTGRVLQPLGGNLSQYATILNRAMFGMVEWDVTEALSITAEVRHAVEDKALIDKSSPSTTTPFIFAAGVGEDRLAQFGCTTALQARAPIVGCRTYPKGSFKGTDPRVTINYKTDSGLLLYANYATGRKPGGFNGTAGILAQTLLGRDASTYVPEKSKGFELGMKFDALDNRVRGSVAVFRNSLTNVQLSTAIPGTTGGLTSIVTSTSNARTQGFEIDLQAAPATGLNLTAGVSYVDAKFRSGCDADLFIYQSGGLRPNFDTANPTAAGLALCDLTGKRLPLGSPWTGNGSISYETELGSGGVKAFGNTNFSYEASKFIQTDNEAETGSTFLLNARLGIKTENFTLAVFGRNLTNEDSIPLATRWFDLRYGSSAGLIPPGLTFDGRPAFAETGSPRGLFGALRKSRTFGVEGTFNF
jgi:iron complex outermembrane recepter protein